MALTVLESLNFEDCTYVRTQRSDTRAGEARTPQTYMVAAVPGSRAGNDVFTLVQGDCYF